jgi:hypothetical protein
MRARSRVNLSGMILFFMAGVVQAHHSPTMFDSSKPMTVSGIVAKLEWTNPHVFVWVYVADAGNPGHRDLYAFENASPNLLELAGSTPTVLKAGDKITIEFAPLRDGRHGGYGIRDGLPTAVTCLGKADRHVEAEDPLARDNQRGERSPRLSSFFPACTCVAPHSVPC